VDGRVVESGVADFTKKRGEGNGWLFLRFRGWLEGLLDICGPDVIAYERAHYRGGAATEVCVGLQTRVQELAEARGTPLAPVTTSELKKFATGNGRASKADMIAAARRHLGRKPESDDEADAVMIALWAAGQMGSAC